MEGKAASQSKKTYSEEFKGEAVRLAYDGSHSAAQVARELGVCRSLLGKWRRQVEAEEQGQNGQSGGGNGGACCLRQVPLPLYAPQLTSSAVFIGQNRTKDPSSATAPWLGVNA